jgi:iron complex transport system ATP-binding protein
MDKLDFPGVVLTRTAEALVVHSQQPLTVLSSAVVGGGMGRVRYLLNRHVHRDYHCLDPVADLVAFARSQGISEAFVGQMTAVSLQQARAVTLRAESLTVATVVTAGLSNATTPGLSAPVTPGPGTINMILLIDACLTPAAMVNAVITATEVKTHVLMARGVRTPEGHAATGTSTDAIAVASTGSGRPLAYAGPVTLLGWLIGRCVRTALEEALTQGEERIPQRAL